MIKVNALRKDFGDFQAVKGISFEVEAGETLVILGTSGSGKTTTLKMLNRLIEPSGGEILIEGKSIYEQDLQLLRRSMGYVIQRIGLFPHYTIAENIAIVPRLLNWAKDKTLHLSRELMTQLKLDPNQYLDAYPHELSGGQQQRVGLARALITDPRIVLMDEPFGALDPITRREIRDEFKNLERLRSKTIVMVTHDVAEAFELGDRVMVMDQGEIVQVGTPLDLLMKPANDFIKSFLHGQALELNLRITSLGALWPTIKAIPSASETPTFAIDTPLATVMEAILPEGRLGIQQGEQIKTTSIEALWQAFVSYKSGLQQKTS